MDAGLSSEAPNLVGGTAAGAKAACVQGEAKLAPILGRAPAVEAAVLGGRVLAHIILILAVSVRAVGGQPTEHRTDQPSTGLPPVHLSTVGQRPVKEGCLVQQSGERASVLVGLTKRLHQGAPGGPSQLVPSFCHGRALDAQMLAAGFAEATERARTGQLVPSLETDEAQRGVGLPDAGGAESVGSKTAEQGPSPNRPSSVADASATTAKARTLRAWSEEAPPDLFPPT